MIVDGKKMSITAKKKLKEKELYTAGYELFLKNGIEKTSIGDIAERAGVAKGTFYLLSLIHIYVEFFAEHMDMQEVLSNYFEVNKLCKQKRAYTKEILVLNDIADLYLNKNDYSSAEKYLLKILSIQREEGINSYSVKVCNSLTRLYIKWGKINEAVKYYRLSCHMQEGIRMLEDDLIYKNVVSAEYNDMIYNYKTAYEVMSDIFKLIKNSRIYHWRRVRCLYYELQLYTCCNEEMIQHTYEKLEEELGTLNDDDKASKIRIDVAKRILDLGYYNFSQRIFNNLEKELEDYNLSLIHISSVDSSIGKSLEEIVTELNKMKINKMS